MLDGEKTNLRFYLLAITCLSVVIIAGDVLGIDQDVNDLQPAISNNQSGPDSVNDLPRDLYKQALSFVERDEFGKAWTLLEQALDNPDAPLVYRKALIILQQLSYGHYRLESLKNPSKNNLVIVKNMHAKARKVHKLLQYITVDNKSLTAFTGAKDRLQFKLSHLMNQCKTQETIIENIDSSEIAFRQGNYLQELNCLKYAADLGGDVDERLAQCTLFVKALKQSDLKQYEDAEILFSNIEITDRHSPAARKMRKEVKTAIFVRDSIDDLGITWKKLDWISLEKLTKEIGNNSLFKKSSQLVSQLDITEKILKERKSYLPSKEKDIITAASHLKEINELLEGNSHNMFSYPKEWATDEWNKLTPKIDYKIKILNQKGNTAWLKYMQNQITDAEIDALTADSNYSAILNKVSYLKDSHKFFSQADRLTNIIDKSDNLRSQEVEPEILITCKRLFSRAYVREQDYGDTEIAKKIYGVVVNMPAFNTNIYLEQADRRLEKLNNK